MKCGFSYLTKINLLTFSMLKLSTSLSKVQIYSISVLVLIFNEKGSIKNATSYTIKPLLFVCFLNLAIVV